MNANARLWVEGLRSGSYRPTSCRLRESRMFFWQRPAFCAIGVLYDLYLKSRGETWSEHPCRGELPQGVLDWAGIPRDLEYEVVDHNDRGMSFRDIASIIEAYFHRAERLEPLRGNARGLESTAQRQRITCQRAA